MTKENGLNRNVIIYSILQKKNRRDLPNDTEKEVGL